MAKSIIIIGAGIGGLSAGIYSRMNGFETRIFEMNSIPGGQCCSWKRQGFTFDGCIHHLFGCAPGSKINGLWRDLGAVPRPMVKLEECTSVKVKRLFFFFADRHQPGWLRHLDRARVDLGKGKRMLVRGGRLDPVYQITVPETLDVLR